MMDGLQNPSNQHDAYSVEGAFFACTLRARLRGLLGCDGVQGVLILAPCRSIHTYGMRFPIDVAFVAASGIVLKAYRNVGSGKRLRCRRAAVTLEREAAEDAAWFIAGQRVLLSGARVPGEHCMEHEVKTSIP